MKQTLDKDRILYIFIYKTRRPCEVSYRFNEAGERRRVSNRTGSIIPFPPEADATEDYVKKSDYKPADKGFSRFLF